jgi:dephospho-CoA kinase
MAVTAREEVAKTFGSDFVNLDGSINRQKLGEQVFVHPDRMEALSQIVSKPLFVYLRDQVLSDKKGLILLEAALFAESGIADWCNYNVVLVTADSTTQERRIADRDGITPDKIQRRVNSQFNGEKKREILEGQIRENHNGKLWTFDDPDGLPLERYEQLFDQVVNTVDIYGNLRKK